MKKNPSLQSDPSAAKESLHAGRRTKSISGNSRLRRLSSIISADDKQEKCFCCKCNAQIRTLTLTMVLFGTITTAQFFAAFISNSLALLGDCASMLVDTFSYAGNIAAECIEGDEQKKVRNQLIASFISILVLLGITSWVTWEALETVLNPPDEDEDVNQYIVFGFAVGGLMFDLFSMCAFYCNSEDNSDNATELNLKSALLHVFSDTCRSTTTLVESILIWFFDFNASKTDAYAALIVSGLIILGALGAISELWFEFKLYRRGGQFGSYQIMDAP